MILDVIDGGLLTTVQDGGRPDWTHLGVPESGAADPWSLAVANLLAGNEPGAAALEITVIGPTLAVRVGGRLGLAGADLGARIDGRPLVPGRSHRVEPGETITIPGADGPSGARCYLAVPGGIDVPDVLGSRSTCLAGGFGGLDGRPLRSGDRIAAARPDDAGPDGPEVVWPADDPRNERSRLGATEAVLRVLPGPSDGLDDLVAGPWRVAACRRSGRDPPGRPDPAAGHRRRDGHPRRPVGRDPGAGRRPPDPPLGRSPDHGRLSCRRRRDLGRPADPRPARTGRPGPARCDGPRNRCRCAARSTRSPGVRCRRDSGGRRLGSAREVCRWLSRHPIVTLGTKNSER